MGIRQDIGSRSCWECRTPAIAAGTRSYVSKQVRPVGDGMFAVMVSLLGGLVSLCLSVQV